MPAQWKRVPIRDRVRYERPQPTFVDVARAPVEPAACTRSTRMDRVAISLSLLCGVHCFLTPILLIAMPALGRVLGDERLHWGMAMFVVPLAAWAIGRGYQFHRRTAVPVLGMIGAALVLTGLFVHGSAHAAVVGPGDSVSSAISSESHCCPGETDADSVESQPHGSHGASTLTTFAGSLFLIGAHGWNVRLCHCRGCGKHDQP